MIEFCFCKNQQLDDKRKDSFGTYDTINYSLLFLVNQLKTSDNHVIVSSKLNKQFDEKT